MNTGLTNQPTQQEAEAQALPRRWWQEPLLWFALLGCAIFVANSLFDQSTDKRLLVTQALQQRLVEQWQGQMGRPPNATELEGLTEQWIKEEIYVREAQAMGLDSNDTIIRRRLAQKLTFLTEDVASAAEPSDTQLQEFYAANLERYRQPARYDFEHRYFSSDRRKDAAADANNALARIRSAPADQALVDASGDSFMLQLQFAGRSERQIGDLFGREFAAELTKLPVEHWQGPLTSAYGEHLVRVFAVQPAQTLPLEQVRNRVVADYAQQRREDANEGFYADLRGQYEVEREAPSAPAPPPPS